MAWSENIQVREPIAGTMHEEALRAWKNKEYGKALKLYRKLADNGSAEASLILSKFYLGDGKVVERDPKRALTLVERAISIEWTPEAALLLGQMYYSGEGCDADYDRAFRLYANFENEERRASVDDARGLFRLGVMYELGKGTEMNLDKAKILYRRSARLGNIHARKNLAVLYGKQGLLAKSLMLRASAIIRGWFSIIFTPTSRKNLP